MSERGEVPVSEVLGDKSKGVKVEESWSKFVPAGGAGGIGQPVFNRESAIMAAVKAKADGTWLHTEEVGHVAGVVKGVERVASNVQFFFVCKGRKMEYIGSREVDLGKFQKDLSGRFFREWVKKQFDGRKDVESIISFGGDAKLKEIVELMEMAE